MGSALVADGVERCAENVVAEWLGEGMKDGGGTTVYGLELV